jgi:hypothetical protein
MSASPDGPRQEPRKSPQQPPHGGKSATPAPPGFRTLRKRVRSFQPTPARKPSQPQPNEAPISQNERPRPDDLRPRKPRLMEEQRCRRGCVPVPRTARGRHSRGRWLARFAGVAQGTVTGWITTGPRVGSSSVAWETPAGVVTSTALGTVPGSAEQMGEVPPGVHTPNRKG